MARNESNTDDNDMSRNEINEYMESIHRITQHLDYEHRDALRGAFIQSVVRMIVSILLFSFAFSDNDFRVISVGVILLFLVNIGSLPAFLSYIRYRSYRL